MKVPAKKLKIKIDFQPMIQYSKFSNLKKLVALYIAGQQTSKETHEVHNLFKALDTNMDGYLSTEELKAALGSDDKNKK